MAKIIHPDEEIWCNTTGFDKKITSTKNKFFIGDICYALKEELYEGLWGKLGWPNGELKNKAGKSVLLVDSTAYGDGMYRAFKDGFYLGGFAVDAGCLGVIPWEYCDAHSTELQWGEIIKVKPGTPMRLTTYGPDRGWRGKFVWQYTDPEGANHKITCSTY